MRYYSKIWGLVPKYEIFLVYERTFLERLFERKNFRIRPHKENSSFDPKLIADRQNKTCSSNGLELAESFADMLQMIKISLKITEIKKIEKQSRTAITGVIYYFSVHTYRRQTFFGGGKALSFLSLFAWWKIRSDFFPQSEALDKQTQILLGFFPWEKPAKLGPWKFLKEKTPNNMH